ncbi:ROK family protein [Nonomuraea sp. NPDC049486]|uniref:ROK family protein n=1 Tax=Nonomuraea sp. NPDC049486 TaxID=3155773 RepID=UPI003432F829
MDIGGTKIAAGLVDHSGTLLATATRPTPATEGPDAILTTATALIHTLTESRGVVIAAGGAEFGRDLRDGRGAVGSDGGPEFGRNLRDGRGSARAAGSAEFGRDLRDGRRSVGPPAEAGRDLRERRGAVESGSAEVGRDLRDRRRAVDAAGSGEFGRGVRDGRRSVRAGGNAEFGRDLHDGTVEPAGVGGRGGRGVVTAVGVGSAGVVDPGRGVVVSATGALVGWAGTDLRGELSRRLGVPVVVGNDVHAHALGEQWRGAAAGREDVLLVAVGTGVGASVMLGGRVRHGAHAVAGHAGHVPVAAAAGRPCPCGGQGHVEAVASGPALIGEYRRRGGTDAADLAGVARLAAAGDPLAADVLAEGGAALGSLIGGLMNVIDPEIVVIGGGVAGCGEPWWRPLRAAIAAEVLPALRDVPVEPAALAGAAALLGAARMALEASP